MAHERTSFITRVDIAAAALADRRHCLEMVSGDDTGRRFVIGARGLTIGRTEPADIVLPA